MKKEEINKLVEHYSEMSDEELSHLIVTRLDCLTDEARQALDIVIRGRDLSVFDNELNATFHDVKSQVLSAHNEQSEQAAKSANIHFLIRYTCLMLVVVGVLIILSDGERVGMQFVKGAGGILIFSEFIYLIRRFWGALFNFDPIKKTEVAEANIAANSSPEEELLPLLEENLMVVVRPCFEYISYEDSFVPFKAQIQSDDGKINEVLDMAWYKIIGDLDIRFVFDGEQSMRNATMQDLKELGLSFEQAMQLAIKNIHSAYGVQEISLWQEGIFQVHGLSADFNSSYFLDREFWSSLSMKYPEGIVVAIPSRGGLLFAPFADNYAVEILRLNIANLVESFPEQVRITSKLYFFKNHVWNVYQPVDQEMSSMSVH